MQNHTRTIIQPPFLFFLLASVVALTGCPKDEDSKPATSIATTATGTTAVGTSPTPAAAPVTAATPQGDQKMSTQNPIVTMTTSLGAIEIELFKDKAPISVDNFLKYVDEGFYGGTIFHRVISNFMIQGGGFTESMSQKPVHASIKNEAGNGLKNERGTLAMARTMVVDSATAQFFINVKDNSFLDHTSNTPQGFGYAVFGKVLSGMDIVDKIKSVPTTSKGGYEDVPTTPVVIQSVQRKAL